MDALTTRFGRYNSCACSSPLTGSQYIHVCFACCITRLSLVSVCLTTASFSQSAAKLFFTSSHKNSGRNALPFADSSTPRVHCVHERRQPLQRRPRRT